MQNLQQITQQVKDAVDKFQSASGEGGVGENLQRALADAHEAMSDLSDNTEALKHNFLFRGFFNKRGFFRSWSPDHARIQESRFRQRLQETSCLAGEREPVQKRREGRGDAQCRGQGQT